MTGQDGAWVPPEGLSGDPAPPTRRPSPARAAGGRPLRMRRSRNPVIAALDGGGEIFQRRGRDVLVGAAALIAPMVVLNLWATVAAVDRLDAGGPAVPGFGDDASTGIEELVTLVAVVFASLTAAVVGIFATTIVIGERFGRRARLAGALTSAVRAAPVAVVAWALSHWWLVLADAFVVGGGSEAFGGRLFLAAMVALFVTPLVLYVGPVIVAERAGPWRAVRRSMRLAKLRYGAALGFVAASATLGGLLMAGVASLPALLEATGMITFGGYAWLANGIAVQIAIVVVVPLVALSTAQMYLEVRLDAEGMDLMLEADVAFGATPVTAR